MQTIPISGTGRSVSFYSDDTIELVRQSIALVAGTHPDRLFMEVKETLPKDYYSTNPKHWSELFYRMSYDGERILPDVLKTYVTQKRPGVTIVEREVSKEDWDAYDESLKQVFDPDTDFDEWRILGKEGKVELWVRNPCDKDVKFQLNMRPDIGLRMTLKGEKGEQDGFHARFRRKERPQGEGAFR